MATRQVDKWKFRQGVSVLYAVTNWWNCTVLWLCPLYNNQTSGGESLIQLLICLQLQNSDVIPTTHDHFMWSDLTTEKLMIMTCPHKNLNWVIFHNICRHSLMFYSRSMQEHMPCHCRVQSYMVRWVRRRFGNKSGTKFLGVEGGKLNVIESLRELWAASPLELL